MKRKIWSFILSFVMVIGLMFSSIPGTLIAHAEEAEGSIEGEESQEIVNDEASPGDADLIGSSVDANNEYVVENVDNTGQKDASRGINAVLSRAAAAATDSNPSVVYVPAGTYLLENGSSLMIGENTILHLDDNATIKRGSNEQGDSTMLWFDGSGAGGYDSFKNVEIYGGVWDCGQNASRERYSDGTGIDMTVFYFAHAQNINIHNTTIKNVRGEHAFVIDGCKDVTVQNSTFQDFYVPVDIDDVLNMEAVHFDFASSITSESKPYDDTPSKNIKVAGCTFKNVIGGVGTHHADKGITTKNSGITIVNNYFENLKGTAITASLTDGGTISGNVLNSSSGDFIQCASSNNLTIENNNADKARYGIYLGYGNYGSSGNIVKGNTISNTVYRGILVQVEPGFTANNPSVTVQNNKVINTKNYGIYVDGYKATIAGNTVDTVSFNSSESGSTADDVSGIRIGATKTGSVIQGNSIKTAKRGIGVYNAENVTIKDNTISNIDKYSIRIIGSGYVIEGNTIDGSENPIALDFAKSSKKEDTIKNNKITNAKDQAITAVVYNADADAASANTLTISNNSIDKAYNYGIFTKDYDNVIIAGNTVKNISHKSGGSVIPEEVAGIKAYCADTKVNIEGNYVANAPIGIWISSCTNAGITKNATKFTSINGIKVGTNSTTVNISGNSVTNSSKNSGSGNDRFGIYATNFYGMSVTNNLAYTQGLFDIDAWDPTGETITVLKDNFVNGNESDRVYGNSSNLTLSGNKKAAVISFNGSAVTVNNGEATLLTVSGESKDSLVSWSSSDTSVARVDQNGVVWPSKEGTTTVTAVKGGNTIKATVTVGPKKDSGGGSGGGDTPKTNYSNEWVNGKWYNADGTQTYKGILQWKVNGTGWWVEDTSGWYPISQWQRIDGKWYYFTETGYMDYSEYRDGCWLNADGSWDERYYGGHWCCNSVGWWYEDAAGWYPNSQWLWIDGVNYWFGVSGYWE